jgi:hypothetical protein
MEDSGIPDVAVHQSEIMISGIASGQQDGRSGTERIAGETPDISERLDFDMCDPVWIWDNRTQQRTPDWLDGLGLHIKSAATSAAAG